MAAPSVTNTFANNTTIDASEVNTNFDDLVNYITNRNSASATWDRVSVLDASNVPLIVNNSTGTQNIANFLDNGTAVFQILNGGNVYMNATAKFYLDGGGDSYIHESSANILQLVSGGSARLQTDSTVGVQVLGTNDFAVPATQKIHLDGGGDSYLHESSANVIQTVTGGTARLQVDATVGVQVIGSNDFAVPATQKIYVDGGGNSYITEEAGDEVVVYVGGTKHIEWNGGSNVLGDQSALATNATDGFVYVPSMSGTPTGTPTSFTGKVPMVYDTANDKFYAYNSSWLSVTFA